MYDLGQGSRLVYMYDLWLKACMYVCMTSGSRLVCMYVCMYV